MGNGGIAAEKATGDRGIGEGMGIFESVVSTSPLTTMV